MRRYFLLFVALTNIHAAYAYSGFGVCNHGKETVASVICNGPTVLKQTQITGDIDITGTLEAEGISVTAMTVMGSADLSASTVRGAVKVAGDLTADHVEFKKGVAVQSDKIMLNHSTVNGLLIITSEQKTPYVQLQCGTDVKGSVMFDGKAGVVQVTGDSIVRGKIVNGSTVFVKRDCSE